MHYSVEKASIDSLREIFPDGEADSMNFVLFSTSGVHGTYNTIEDVELDEECDSVTFVVIHPRVVCMRYGNAIPQTPEDIKFLKRLRESSHRVMAEIGKPDSK